MFYFCCKLTDHFCIYFLLGEEIFFLQVSFTFSFPSLIFHARLRRFHRNHDTVAENHSNNADCVPRNASQEGASFAERLHACEASRVLRARSRA